MSQYAVVLAARMGSSRLPGKALADYGAGPILRTVIDRWRMSDRNPTIVFTTTTNSEDDPLAQLAHEQGVPVSRGSPTNVVEQMDTAVLRHAPTAQWVARALADNPLVDVGLADARLDVLEKTQAEGLWYGGGQATILSKGVMTPWTYANWDKVAKKGEARIIWSNSLEGSITYAGTTDVWNRTAWNRIVNRSSGSQLEHPGQHYWNNIDDYKAIRLPLPRREYLLPFRTELDTELDLDMLRRLWQGWSDHFGGSAPSTKMPTLWVLKYLEAHPDIAKINSDVPVKTQSHASFSTTHKAWICENCQRRGGSLVEGNLEVVCQSCGSAHSYFTANTNRGYRRR